MKIMTATRFLQLLRLAKKKESIEKPKSAPKVVTTKIKDGKKEKPMHKKIMQKAAKALEKDAKDYKKDAKVAISMKKPKKAKMELKEKKEAFSAAKELRRRARAAHV
jgi:hypothetical protein